MLFTYVRISVKNLKQAAASYHYQQHPIHHRPPKKPINATMIATVAANYFRT